MMLKVWLRSGTLTVIGWMFGFSLCPSHAAPGNTTTIVFHCPAACKIYRDGNLLASLPSGGLKQATFAAGVKTTILISRPSKPDWVRIITPTKSLSINPDEPNPRSIPDDEPGSDREPATEATNQPSYEGAGKGAPESASQQQTIPAWASAEMHTLPKSEETKRVLISSHRCPRDIEMALTLDIDEGGSGDLFYTQTMHTPLDDSVKQSNWCIENFESPEFDQSWGFDVPIRVTKVSEDLLTFAADMKRCSRCELPPGTSQITGQVKRDGANVKLELGPPLDASFTLEAYKKRN